MNTFHDTDYEGYKLNGQACSINQFYILPYFAFEYVREDWCTYNALVFGWLFWNITFEFAANKGKEIV